MADGKKNQIRNQILSVLLVLGLGVALALVLSIATLYYFGPTGSYLAGNVLVSPEVSSTLSYFEPGAARGSRPNHFVFDRIEYLYFDPSEKAWKRAKVGKEEYQKFYDLISSERSLVMVAENIPVLFEQATPAVLTVIVKNEGGGGVKEMRAFQELQIVKDGDYFRIQIHDAREGENWAYFYYPGIYKESLKLLLQ